MSETLDEIIDSHTQEYKAGHNHLLKQQLLQWVADEVVGKNYGRSIIGEFNEKDAHANKLVNETLDFANARLEKQRQILKAHGWKGGES